MKKLPLVIIIALIIISCVPTTDTSAVDDCLRATVIEHFVFHDFGYDREMTKIRLHYNSTIYYINGYVGTVGGTICAADYNISLTPSNNTVLGP